LNIYQQEKYLDNEYMKEVVMLKDHIKFIYLFWRANVEDLWIFLDDAFIEEWLTEKKISDIITIFTKNLDYKESEFESVKRYMVKGHCLKHLSIICNSNLRDLFVKVDRIAYGLVLSKSKSIEEDRKLGKKLSILNEKMDNLTYLIEDIVSERVEALTKNIVPNEGCEEVFNFIKLPSPFNPASHCPRHLRRCNYILVKCLRKNYDKHLNRVKTYGDGGSDIMMEEVFPTPIATGGVDIVKELKQAGIKTYKSNGVGSTNVVHLITTVNSILGLEQCYGYEYCKNLYHKM
jgi:hypothetical protein